LGQAIDGWLDTQNATNRAIFLRRYWFGDYTSIIAIDLNMTESAVYTRLSRMRTQLKDYLTKEGYYE
jgi:RNA polymerase sigma-70 factor (ECF subfamily)